jgi:hypothetical protein
MARATTPGSASLSMAMRTGIGCHGSSGVRDSCGSRSSSATTASTT